MLRHHHPEGALTLIAERKTAEGKPPGLGGRQALTMEFEGPKGLLHINLTAHPAHCSSFQEPLQPKHYPWLLNSYSNYFNKQSLIIYPHWAQGA